MHRTKEGATIEDAIRQRLWELADDDYRRFSAGLLPGVDGIVGVRLPLLRKLAAQIAAGDWRAYLRQAKSEWFEEIMLQGMVIGCAKCEIEETLCHTAAFVPKIDNWSVCDSFCAGLKCTARHRERVWNFLQPYLRSERPYDVRFAVVMLLNYYIDEAYLARVLENLNSIRQEHYYVKMAVAWAVSVCFAKLPQQTMPYLLHHHTLDAFTYHKALQKILESNRVGLQDKARIRELKRRTVFPQ